MPTAKSSWGKWFKGHNGKVDEEEVEMRRRERVTGKVRRTRRMTREEGEVLPQEPLD